MVEQQFLYFTQFQMKRLPVGEYFSKNLLAELHALRQSTYSSALLTTALNRTIESDED